jgi:Xaa-Pro aminopeptidase
MPNNASLYAGRVSRLRAGFSEQDALLILHAKNIRYLTGFTGSEGALLVGPTGLALLVDGRYTTQARGEAVGAEVVEFRNRVDGIMAVANQHAIRSIGFESPSLSVEEYLRLQERLPGVDFQPLSERFQTLRAVKDHEEISLIREAARISADALASIREMIRPGVPENEIALELDCRMRRTGAEQPSFETIVAAGANAALPHATPGCRTIEDGDCVMIDYGAVWEGYHSDETCTYVMGSVSARQREVYTLVREAHDRAIRAVRAGVSCCEIDRIARTCLEDAGLGTYFSHGTGHGVGLDVHEAPRLAAGRDEVLQAGMVVTVEPGIYLPGVWGIRIEDTVLVTAEGSEVLTRTSKDLTIL